MKLAKKVLVSLVAVSMMVGGTGCVKKPEVVSSGKTSKGSVEAGKVATTSEDIWAPYEETVTITTVLPENGGIKFREGDDYDNNPWYREFKDRFNIEVKNDWVSNEYGTKLNLSIADGSTPDVFVVGYQQLQQLQEANLIWDMTEIFEEYASDNLKEYRELEPSTFEVAKFDDRLYAIPQLTYGIIDQPTQVWIRQDLKEGLGLEDPKTMDDLVEMARTFKDEFGGYPIAENQGLDALKIIATGFGAQPGIWIEQTDGTIGYGSIQPEMKDALEEYAKWYKEGLINPEFMVSDSTKMFQSIINGEAGIVPYYQWMGYNPGVNVITNLGKEAVFDAYRVPTATGQPSKASIGFANIGYVVVNKKCENPEAVVKLLNFYSYMLDDAQEKEGAEIVDELFNNAYGNIVYALRIINPMTDYDLFVGVTEALAKGLDEDVTHLGSGAVKYHNSVEFIKNGSPSGVGDYMQMGSPKSAYSVSKQMIDDGHIVKNKVWGIQPETILNTGSTLNDILQEGFTKIIVGEEPIDYFDALVKSWEQAGGTQATQEVNEMNQN